MLSDVLSDAGWAVYEYQRDFHDLYTDYEDEIEKVQVVMGALQHALDCPFYGGDEILAELRKLDVSGLIRVRERFIVSAHKQRNVPPPKHMPWTRQWYDEMAAKEDGNQDSQEQEVQS